MLRIGGVDRQVQRAGERAIGCAGRRLVLGERLTPGKRHPYAAFTQPFQALAGLVKGPFSAFGVMNGRIMGIQRDAQHHPVTIVRGQPFQTLLDAWPHHRAHRIGQQQQAVPGTKHILHDVQYLRAHEGFTARDADLDRLVNLLKEWPDIGAGQIDQPVIARRAFNVAIRAFDVAQRPRIQPQRLQPGPTDAGAGLALCRDVGIGEFGRGIITVGHTSTCSAFGRRFQRFCSSTPEREDCRPRRER